MSSLFIFYNPKLKGQCINKVLYKIKLVKRLPFLTVLTVTSQNKSSSWQNTQISIIWPNLDFSLILQQNEAKFNLATSKQNLSLLLLKIKLNSILLLPYSCILYLQYLMDRISERRNNLLQIRKFQFITDNSSKAESQSDLSSSQSQIQFYSKSRPRSEFKSFAKLKEQIRKARKFLTESQRSSYESSYSQGSEQYSPKRRGADLQNVRNNPEKKVKKNEEQVDLNKIMQQGLSFVQKMKSSLAAQKK